jgi:metal-dependent HD superfamily phosphatase/phosphodiesterase
MGDTSEVIAKDRVAVTPPAAQAALPQVAPASAGTTGPVEAARAQGQVIGLRDVRNNPKIRTYIEKANEQMAVIGYSEHGLRHAALVAAIARNICLELGMEARTAEMAAIAGYLHDIGNCVHRFYHPQIGATMAFQLLDAMGMEAEEIATVIGAIGNHEEPEGVPINPVTAAVIIADKSDVHFTRVQNPDPTTYDIHDRVNHAVQKSRLLIDRVQQCLTLDLVIDVTKATVMEYFEIFVVRMIMCRKAAEKLGCQFKLIINGVEL